MFSRLRGFLLEKQPPLLVIDVQGVGYEVEAPLSTFYHLPLLHEEVSLFVHFSVREDAQVLYGFINEKERELFRHLIRISGVGPKLALSVLSSMELAIFVQCIQEDNIARLIRIPGVGRKTAERLVIEMRDRLKNWYVEKSEEDSSRSALTRGLVSPSEDAISALIALGYKPKDANDWINSIDAEESGLTSEELIRRALQKAL